MNPYHSEKYLTKDFVELLFILQIFYKYFTFFVLYLVLGQPKKIENYNRMPWSSILDFEWQFLRHKSCLRIFRNKKSWRQVSQLAYFVWVRGQTTQAKQKSNLYRDQLISFYIFIIFDRERLVRAVF